MEPEGTLPHSQVAATWPSPQPARSSPCPTSHFLKIRLNIILQSMPGSPKWSTLFEYVLEINLMMILEGQNNIIVWISYRALFDGFLISSLFYKLTQQDA